MTSHLSLECIQSALSIPQFDGPAAHLKMAPVPRLSRRPVGRVGNARLGGVLLLLYQRDDELSLVLTRRRDDLKSHAGQVSFPGGRKEPDESLLETALRETYEEIGISRQQVSVLGALTPLYIFPSDFEVHPFVAWYANGRQPTFVPATEEVAEIIEVPVRHLLDESTRREEMWTIRGFDLQVPFFQVDEHKVWGATAMMLSEFVERLRRIGASD